MEFMECLNEKKKGYFLYIKGRVFKLLPVPTCLILSMNFVDSMMVSERPLTTEYHITFIRLVFVRTNTGFVVMCKILSVVIVFF